MPKIKGTIKNGCCYCIDSQVDNTAYGSSWNGKCDKAPSQNSVYAKFEGIKQFTPSNTGSSGQMLQKTSSGYAWCNINTDKTYSKITSQAICFTYNECCFTVPATGYIRYAFTCGDTRASYHVSATSSGGGYMLIADGCCKQEGIAPVYKGMIIKTCRNGYSDGYISYYCLS